MPYAPVFNTQGPAMIQQGLSSFGNSIGAGIREYRQRNDMNDQVDGALQQMQSFGLLTPQAYAQAQGQPMGFKLGLLKEIQSEPERAAQMARTQMMQAQTKGVGLANQDEEHRQANRGNFKLTSDSTQPGVAVFTDDATGKSTPVNTPSPKAPTSIPPPDWANKIVAADPNLYWNGAHITHKGADQSGLLSGLLGPQGGAPAAPGAPGAQPQAPSAGGGGMPRVNSPAEAMKLPRGTKFIDPQGVVRTRN